MVEAAGKPSFGERRCKFRRVRGPIRSGVGDEDVITKEQPRNAFPNGHDYVRGSALRSRSHRAEGKRTAVRDQGMLAVENGSEAPSSDA